MTNVKMSKDDNDHDKDDDISLTVKKDLFPLDEPLSHYMKTPIRLNKMISNMLTKANLYLLFSYHILHRTTCPKHKV